MILTRDNILKYVKEKKAVIPTMIAEDFDTSTMIASAALSELAKDNLIKITNLKLASSPYYYDPKQSSILIELGQKHLKGYDKEVFLKLKEQEVLNAGSLSIQESLAIERIKDFAKELNIEFNGKNLKFWVWYQRNLDDTKKQILDVLKGSKKEEKTNKNTLNNLKREEKNSTNNKLNLNKEIIQKEKITKTINSYSNENKIEEVKINNFNKSNNNFENQHNNFTPKEVFENKIEAFIEKYFKENYLLMESKLKTEKGIEYDVKLIANKIEIDFDCFYFKKKPSETDIIKFYSSSIKPKIVFIENSPKKLLKLAENLENLTIVNI